jgi:hypothetical protein
MTGRRLSYVDKTIVVRKSIYVAAQKLAKEAELIAGAKPFRLAEMKINDCHAVRHKVERQFWRDVWTHLKLLEQRHNEIRIIEDGNNW